MKEIRITRTKAVEAIENSKGRFFTTTFTTKAGNERTINCNFKKGNVTKLGHLRVNSIQDKGLRSVDPRTISKLVINNQIFKVK